MEKAVAQTPQMSRRAILRYYLAALWQKCALQQSLSCVQFGTQGLSQEPSGGSAERRRSVLLVLGHSPSAPWASTDPAHLQGGSAGPRAPHTNEELL